MSLPSPPQSLPAIDPQLLSDINTWTHEQHLAHDLYHFFQRPEHWRVFVALVGQRPPYHGTPLDIRSLFCRSVPHSDPLPVYRQTNVPSVEPSFELQPGGTPNPAPNSVPHDLVSRKSAIEKESTRSSSSAISCMSLNLLNFLCTNYCSLVCVHYAKSQYASLDDLFLSESEFARRCDANKGARKECEPEFVLKNDYDAKLDVYCKKHFDPYAREPNVLVGGVVSSLKQLNYLRWAIENRVVNYACHHRVEISSFKYCLHRNPKARKDEPIKLIQKKYTRKRSAAIVQHFNERLASREQVQYIFYG